MDQHGASALEQIIAHVNDVGDVLLPRQRNSGRVAQTGRGVGCDSRPEAAPGTQQLGAVALFAVSPANADHSETLGHRQVSKSAAPIRPRWAWMDRSCWRPAGARLRQSGQHGDWVVMRVLLCKGRAGE